MQDIEYVSIKDICLTLIEIRQLSFSDNFTSRRGKSLAAWLAKESFLLGQASVINTPVLHHKLFKIMQNSTTENYFTEYVSSYKTCMQPFKIFFF